MDRALKAVGSFPSTAGAAVRLRGLLWYQVDSLTATAVPHSVMEIMHFKKFIDHL